MQPTVLTGIQPTGVPQLGNLLGFFKPALTFQHTHRAFYFIVDHHAITVRQVPAELHEKTLGTAAWYLAAGLNPEKATLFVQSHVPAHLELGWIMTTFAMMGELERMTQFKDKAAQHAENINLGLFSYPVLQAADILLYHATEVPVGDDQKQHVELCRDIAIRVNNAFGPIFTVPKHSLPPVGARVKDLQDPTRKMSKSRPGLGCIVLTDSPDDIRKKFKRAVTDSLGQITYAPETQPGVANLLEIMAACQNITPQAAAASLAGQQYGSLKEAVGEAVVAVVAPLQQRYAELMANPAELQRILATGAAKANQVASTTLQQVKTKLGFVMPA